MNPGAYLPQGWARIVCCLWLTMTGGFSAIVTSQLDAGGHPASSVSYAMDGSIGAFCGVSSVQPAQHPAIVARHGYVGQLYEMKSLNVAASAARVNESSQARLVPMAVNDDGSLLALNPNDITWTVVLGPVHSLTSDGMVSTAAVYEDTSAFIAARYLTASNTISLTVVNTGNDDFETYARDGMDDAWQVRYFGLNQTNANPNYDFDHDGVSNLNEYIADTNPTNAASFFHLQSFMHANGNQVRFVSSTQRKYTLYYTTNLTLGAWQTVAGQTDIPGTGYLDFLADPANLDPARWYRIGVRLP